MERQNAKIQAAAKRDEAARVRRLVEQAMRKDPRMIKFREEQENMRLAKKQARDDIRRKKIEEEQKAAEELKRIEEQRIAEENFRRQEAKKAKENQKKWAKKIRRKMLAMAEGNPELNSENIKLIVESIAVEDLEAFSSRIEREEMTRDEVLLLLERAQSVGKSENKVDERKIERRPDEASSNQDGKQLPWSHQELALLTKAVSRFPGGTHERWEKIANFIKTRSVNEVMQKAKDLKKSTKKAVEEQIDIDQQKPASSEIVAAQQDVTSKEDDAAPSWSESQQRQLETALRIVPRDDPDRWDNVAKLVEGKSKKDCIARFKEIRAALINSKKAS